MYNTPHFTEIVVAERHAKLLADAVRGRQLRDLRAAKPARRFVPHWSLRRFRVLRWRGRTAIAAALRRADA
jgi:hypothetical protein